MTPLSTRDLKIETPDEQANVVVQQPKTPLADDGQPVQQTPNEPDVTVGMTNPPDGQPSPESNESAEQAGEGS